MINIGPDEESLSLNELIKMLNSIMGKNITASYQPFRPQEVKIALCSAEKARQILDYKKVISLRSALEELVKWIQLKEPTKFSYNQTAEINYSSLSKAWKQKRLD